METADLLVEIEIGRCPRHHGLVRCEGRLYSWVRGTIAVFVCTVCDNI